MSVSCIFSETFLKESLKILKLEGVTSSPWTFFDLFWEKSSLEVSKKSDLPLGPFLMLYFQIFCSISSNDFG